MKKILVVVTDEMQGIIMRKILGEQYHMILASSAGEAAELFEKEQPDLVLAQMMGLSDATGSEFRDLLQKRQSGVLAMMFMVVGLDKISAYGFEVNNAGCTDYISYPCAPNELLKRVETMLSNVEYIQSLRDAKKS